LLDFGIVSKETPIRHQVDIYAHLESAYNYLKLDMIPFVPYDEHNIEFDFSPLKTMNYSLINSSKPIKIGTATYV